MIIPSEVSQTEKDGYHTISLYVESIKKRYKCTYSQNRNRFTDLQSELKVTGGRVGARDT